MDVEYVSDQVRDNRRTWAALWKGFLETCNLSKDRCNFRMQGKFLIFQEITAHAPKVDGAEEILQIDIEDISPILLLTCISDNGAPTFEAMGDAIRMLVFVATFIVLVYLIYAVVK